MEERSRSFVDVVHAFVAEPAVLIEGQSGRPLTGTTLAVKDLFDVVGTITGGGNPRFAAGQVIARKNAAAVELLTAAGATVVGKTITDELAYSLSGTNVHYGTPVNVAAPGRVPGGSSAGSAAAVAAGLVDLALGTDTGGSVRVPASYCGIIGWRPTHGAIDIAGVVPLAPSFDTVGVFARRIDLLATAAAILLGDADPSGDLEPSGAIGHASMRVVAETRADSTAGVAAEVDRVAAVLGADPRPLVLGVDLATAMAAFRTLQGWEAWQAHGGWITAQYTHGGPGFGRGIAGRFESAARVTAADVAQADEIRADVLAAVLAATADETILIMPAAAGSAPTPEHDPSAHEAQRMRTLRLTCIAGLSGAPAVVIPVAADEGLPLGIALVGAPGSDRRLLRIAAAAIHSLCPITE
ncbi:MAG: amidase [Ilumatobacteraceae bacterium]